MVEHKQLEFSIFTETLNDILKKKDVVEILKTSTHEDIQLLKTALPKARIWQFILCERIDIVIIIIINNNYNNITLRRIFS